MLPLSTTDILCGEGVLSVDHFRRSLYHVKLLLISQWRLVVLCKTVFYDIVIRSLGHRHRVHISFLMFVPVFLILKIISLWLYFLYSVSLNDLLVRISDLNLIILLSGAKKLPLSVKLAQLK